MPVLHEHVSCEILVTGKCNMRCDYCIAAGLSSSTMTEETGRQVVDYFVHLAEGATDVEVTFSGGEPLLAFSLVKGLTSYAEERTSYAGMQSNFVVKTNGTRLNDEMIAFFRSHRVKVVVSIDGLPSAHDTHRRLRDGNKTHATVCRNLATLVQHGVPCVASMTVHPDSYPMIALGLRLLHSLGVKEVDLGPVYGTAEWTDERWRGWVRSLLAVAEYVREVHANGGCLDVGPFYRESEHRNGILSNRWGCHAATSHLAFLPSGEIAGCSALGMMLGRFPQLSLGNVFDGLDQQAVDWLVGLAQAPAEARAACQGCVTAANCTGGCLAINLGTTGSPLAPPAFYCNTISAIPEAWDKAWAASLPVVE